MSISAKPIWCLASPQRPSNSWRRSKISASFPARNMTTSSGPLRRTNGWPRAEIRSGAVTANIPEPRARSLHLDHPLAAVFAGEQSDQGLRRIFQAIDNVLLDFQL